MKYNLSENTGFNKSFLEDLDSHQYLPVSWIKTDGTIFKVNEAVCNYLGYSKQELQSMSILQIDCDADDEKLAGIMDTLRKYKVSRFEARHRRKDGTILDVEVIANYYHVDGTEFTVSYTFDITEKKQKERELLELNNRLENMVEEKTKELSRKIKELEESEYKAKQNEELFINAFKTSQDSINLNDIENGTYLQINDGFTQIMGYPPEEVVGKSSLDLNIWKNPEDRAKLVRGIKEKGYYHNLEADFLRKDGTIVHGLMSASIQEYNGKKVLLNVSKDITKIKKLENELKVLNEELQKKVEMEVSIRRRQDEVIFEQKKLSDLGLMINAIAHQWRQPLNVIGLQSQDLADVFRMGALTEEYMNEFESSQLTIVQYLSTILDDFRNFFKPDDKETEFEVIKEVLGLLNLIQIQLNAKGIKLFISCKCKYEDVAKCTLSDFPNCRHNETLVKGYCGEFKQVIANLIYNSISAVEERISTKQDTEGFIHILIHKQQEKVTVNVEDNGGGIPEDIKSKIFNPYFTTKEEGKGTGLGLYLAKLIIQTHMNGVITAENIDNGVSFEITLPAVV